MTRKGIIKDLVFIAIFIFMTGFGASMMMHVAIGVSAWDGLTQSMAEVTQIKVGTMGFILNFVCLAIQVVLKNGKIDLKTLLQVPMSLLLGSVVNFVYYDLLVSFEVTNYGFALLFFLIGQTVLAASIAGIMVVDRLIFPVEGMCLQISQKAQVDFVKVRQMVDVICVLLVIVIYVVAKNTLTIREGTLIGVLIFSPMVGFFMKVWQPLIKGVHQSHLE